MLAAIGSAALFAGSAPPVGPVFEAHCGTCHTLSDVAARISARPQADRAAFLTRFLGRHYPPPPADRESITNYLLTAASQ